MNVKNIIAISIFIPDFLFDKQLFINVYTINFSSTMNWLFFIIAYLSWVFYYLHFNL